MDYEKDVKALLKRINRNKRENFSGTVLEKLFSITEADIEAAQKELEEKNLIKTNEIFIGRLNQREKRVIALVCKLKNELAEELVKKNLPKADRKNWDLSTRLGHDIKFGKSWLVYLVKLRFNLPENFDLDFRRGFQIIGWHREQRFENFMDDDD